VVGAVGVEEVLVKLRVPMQRGGVGVSVWRIGMRHGLVKVCWGRVNGVLVKPSVTANQ